MSPQIVQSIVFIEDVLNVWKELKECCFKSDRIWVARLQSKTIYNGVEWWCWKQASTCGATPMVCWMMMWRRETLNAFNMLNLSQGGPRGVLCLAKTGACNTLSDNNEWSCRRRREKVLCWYLCDTWLILIGCSDFSHFNNLNSVISL